VIVQFQLRMGLTLDPRSDFKVSSFPVKQKTPSIVTIIEDIFSFIVDMVVKIFKILMIGFFVYIIFRGIFFE